MLVSRWMMKLRKIIEVGLRKKSKNRCLLRKRRKRKKLEFKQDNRRRERFKSNKGKSRIQRRTRHLFLRNNGSYLEHKRSHKRYKRQKTRLR
jgi:hypothetical protein